MALSRPLLELTATYLQHLYLSPIRTKSLTSCAISASANLCSQLIAGEKNINVDSVLAFAAFGLFFGGSVPHFFYKYLEKFIPSGGVKFAIFKQLLIERLLYTPCFQSLSLYMISRFEGKDHATALRTMHKLLPSIVQANWKWLTLFQILNLTYVPPIFRVLVVNLIGFFWVMYVAKSRRNQQKTKRT